MHLFSPNHSLGLRWQRSQHWCLHQINNSFLLKIMIKSTGILCKQPCFSVYCYMHPVSGWVDSLRGDTILPVTSRFPLSILVKMLVTNPIFWCPSFIIDLITYMYGTKTNRQIMSIWKYNNIIASVYIPNLRILMLNLWEKCNKLMNRRVLCTDHCSGPVFTKQNHKWFRGNKQARIMTLYTVLYTFQWKPLTNGRGSIQPTQ